MKFQAFDTETINRPGFGYACLLIKMGAAGPELLEFPDSFDSIFKFLEGGHWVAWNMDFDARAIFHDHWIPYSVVEDLGINGRAAWKGYYFKYVQSKFFEVSRKGGGKFEIFDVKQFYGTSLEKASEAFLSQGQGKTSIPKCWYNELDECLRDNRRSRVLDYARRDVIATQALSDKLTSSIEALGMKIRRLTSCAGLARSHYGKILKAERPPDYVNRIFEKSFFGGRIEVGRLGLVGPCRLFDIHSAYPSVLATLRSPRGRVFESGPEWKYRGASYGSYKIRLRVPLSWHWGPLAYRHGIKVIYPVGVFDTHCGVSAVETLRKFKVPFEIFKAYEIFQTDKTPIFKDIEFLYNKRKDSHVGMAIKTILNSTYGLTAESVRLNTFEMSRSSGTREIAGRHVRSYSKFGKLANFILAAHITETIRMKLWEVLHEHGEKAVYGATDGVLLDSGTQGPVCLDSLGGWGIKSDFETGAILGCGRYYFKKLSGGFEFNLRGFPVRDTHFTKFQKTRRKHTLIPCLETDSLRQWAGNFMGSLNVLLKFNRRFEIKDEKRYWFGEFQRIQDAWALTIQSKPFIMGTLDEISDLKYARPNPRRDSKPYRPTRRRARDLEKVPCPQG